MEPNSAPYLNRIEALKTLHNKGCKTWVSIEPYPTPNIIDQNFSEYDARNRFYNRLAEQVIKFCNKNDIAYHIKNGTVRQYA
jgi:DNA repair photolyase